MAQKWALRTFSWVKVVELEGDFALKVKLG
jgi:hypothetical protein